MPAWIAAAAVAGIAAFTPGDLSFSQCLGEAAGCTPAATLDGAGGVAVSPDGTSVYVASDDGAVTHLRRGRGGRLALRGCVGDRPQCAPGAGLAGAEGVAVSPDGTSVYVAAGDPGVVVHLRRARNGGLTFAGCLADDEPSGPRPRRTAVATQAGCARATALAGAADVAVSPDGASVYVVSDTDSSLSHFRRAPGGELASAGCVGGEGSACAPAPRLGTARALAVSPDGAGVYVAAIGDDALTHFRRDADGNLALAGCHADGGAGGCRAVEAMEDPAAVTVSPDGTSLYVASRGEAAITHFRRSASGELAVASCIAGARASGCRTARAVDHAAAVAVSPDGRSVYLGSDEDGSVAHLRRAPGGGLAFASCAPRPARRRDGVDLPRSVSDIAVSPDGASAYVVAFGAVSVSHFTRRGRPGPARACTG